jgi:Fe2+ or Zn2+ uptake regulation protein
MVTITEEYRRDVARYEGQLTAIDTQLGDLARQGAALTAQREAIMTVVASLQSLADAGAAAGHAAETVAKGVDETGAIFSQAGTTSASGKKSGPAPSPFAAPEPAAQPRRRGRPKGTTSKKKATRVRKASASTGAVKVSLRDQVTTAVAAASAPVSVAEISSAVHEDSEAGKKRVRTTLHRLVKSGALVRDADRAVYTAA